jgi:hypothetical protein
MQSSQGVEEASRAHAVACLCSSTKSSGTGGLPDAAIPADIEQAVEALQPVQRQVHTLPQGHGLEKLLMMPILVEMKGDDEDDGDEHESGSVERVPEADQSGLRHLTPRATYLVEVGITEGPRHALVPVIRFITPPHNTRQGVRHRSEPCEISMGLCQE